jgi:hypothetical protein
MKKNLKKPDMAYKIFSAYWWNPFFWVLLIVTPFLLGLFTIIEIAIQIYEDLKEWDLK